MWIRNDARINNRNRASSNYKLMNRASSNYKLIKFIFFLDMLTCPSSATLSQLKFLDLKDMSCEERTCPPVKEEDDRREVEPTRTTQLLDPDSSCYVMLWKRIDGKKRLRHTFWTWNMTPSESRGERLISIFFPVASTGTVAYGNFEITAPGWLPFILFVFGVFWNTTSSSFTSGTESDIK